MNDTMSAIFIMLGVYFVVYHVWYFAKRIFRKLKYHWKVYSDGKHSKLERDSKEDFIIPPDSE